MWDWSPSRTSSNRPVQWDKTEKEKQVHININKLQSKQKPPPAVLGSWSLFNILKSWLSFHLTFLLSLWRNYFIANNYALEMHFPYNNRLKKRLKMSKLFITLLYHKNSQETKLQAGSCTSSCQRWSEFCQSHHITF